MPFTSTLAVRIVHHDSKWASLRITTKNSIVFLTLNFEHFLNFNTEMLRLLIQLLVLVCCLLLHLLCIGDLHDCSGNSNNSYSYTAVT